MRREDTPSGRVTGGPFRHGRRSRRVLSLAALALTTTVVTSGCSVEEVLRFGWPVGVTPEATEMRLLWTWSAVAALVVGAIVWGLTAWTVAFHRRKADASELPRQFQYNLPLELVLTVVPLIIVGVLFYFTVIVQNNVDRVAVGNELKVEITGFQWNWEFTYPDSRAPDNPPGAGVRTTSPVPLLVLPTKTPIAFTQRSEDVIHSFWVPEFLFKRDVFPYPEKNDQKNTWVITGIERTGAFVGRCAEYCGSYHSMMNFEVRALPSDLFDRYIQIRQTVNPATGQGFTAADALAELGSERRDCADLCNPNSVTTQVFNPDPTANQAFR